MMGGSKNPQPESFRDAQRERNRSVTHLAIGDRLAKIGGWVASGRLQDVDQVHAYVLVLLTEEGPLVEAKHADADDLDAAWHAAADYAGFTQRRWRREEGESRQEYVTRWWRQRARHREQAEAKDRAKLAERPWQCEHCDRRYKTERGASQHERSCWKNPTANQFTSGEYEPSLSDDGRVTGFVYRGGVSL